MKSPIDFAERFPIKDKPMYMDLIRHHTAMVDAEERAWWSQFRAAVYGREIERLGREVRRLEEEIRALRDHA